MITTTREEREEEATIQFKGLKNPTPTHLNKGKLEEERAGRGVGGGMQQSTVTLPRGGGQNGGGEGGGGEEEGRGGGGFDLLLEGSLLRK